MSESGRPDLAGVPLRDLVREMLKRVGEDPDRPGLRATPERVENSLQYLTRGYGMNVADIVGRGIFEEKHRNMVLVKDIEMYSLCEHHLLPFFGKAHVAYIPDGRIVGLSKVARLVDVFARRLQVQERLTDQIACALDDVLQPLGVAVIVEAYHLCMMMRGVEKQNTLVTTSSMLGLFREDARTRSELLTLFRTRQQD